MGGVLVVVADGREEVRDVMVVQPILDVASFATADDELLLAQHPKLLRHRARIHLDLVGELLDGARGAQQGEKDSNPAVSAEDLHRGRDVSRLDRAQGTVGIAMFGWVRHAISFNI